jgi:hypothetical protein
MLLAVLRLVAVERIDPPRFNGLVHTALAILLITGG